MGKRSQNKNRAFAGLACVAVFLTVGCSPSEQPMATPTSNIGQQSAAVVQSNVSFAPLKKAVLSGEESGKYKVKIAVSLGKGSIQTNLSVYGSVNVPERAALSIHENTTSTQFYQQGLSAYYQDNGPWSQVSPISNIDVFPQYIRLVQSASSHGNVLQQLKDAFVTDEYCSIYRVTLPATETQALPVWAKPVVPGDVGNITYTFAVGKTDGQLREVTTTSVTSSALVGTITMKTDTLIFDLGNDIADVQPPQDLLKQLQGS